MTKEQLKARFAVYTEQIPRLRNADAYWALLHYIVIFPDICGALESANGEATGPRYKDWATRYIATELLSGDEWYEIRCKVLHQGITIGEKRYSNYKFVSTPDSNGNVVHRSVFNDVMVLDVRYMADEMLQGLDRWFEDISNKTNPVQTQNVERNINSLATVQSSNDALGGIIQGLNLFVSASTSSNP